MGRTSRTWTQDRDRIRGHGARLYIRLNHVNLFPIRRAVLALKELIHSDPLKPATRRAVSCEPSVPRVNTRRKIAIGRGRHFIKVLH